MTIGERTIAAGQAVRHRTRRDLHAGRVRYLVGATIATVVWVGRRNLSCVRVANLEPIADAELARAFADREAERERWNAEEAGKPTPVRHEPPSDEHRRFLLGNHRTIEYRLDPALAAYLGWLGDRPFVPRDYDLFAAGYRAKPATIESHDAPTDEVRRRCWPDLDRPVEIDRE